MENLSIEIVQGSTFEWLMLLNDVNGIPLDMSGYTDPAGARSSIRKKYSDVDSTADFTVSILNNTGVLAAIASGTCHLTTAEIAALEPDSVGSCYLLLTMDATTTAAIPKGLYVYDVEVQDTTGYVFKPYFGNCLVQPEATK